MSKQGIIFIAAFFLIVGLAVYGVYSIFFPKIDIRALPIFNETPQIKEVVKIKRVKVPVKDVQVIEKTKIVKELQLPEWVKKDENQQVLTTGLVMPNKNKGEIEAVTTINTETGESTMFMRQKERSLFGFENEKYIKAGYGISAKHGNLFAVRAGWEFVRIIGIHLSVEGEVNSEPDGRAMLWAKYEFN